MCGLFGFVNYGGKAFPKLDAIIQLLGKSSAVRGTDATGIAFNLEGKLHIDKEAKSAYQFKFDVPDTSRVVLGHTRKTTQGNEKKNYNNHPFRGKVGELQFALAHNGVLHNDIRLRNQLGLEKSKIETDSYVAVQLIEKLGKWDTEALKYVGENVEGMFSFTLMDDQDNWYLIKNDSPLVMLHFPELQVYVYASTQTILFEAILYSSALCGELINPFKTGVVTAQLLEPKAGEIWKIDSTTGTIEKSTFKPAEDRRYYSSYWDKEYVESDYWNGGSNWSRGGTYRATSTNRGSVVTTAAVATTKAATATSVEKTRTEINTTNRITDKEYFEMLLQIAEGMGHSKEDIRLLKNFGYSLDEIEMSLFDRTLDVILEETKNLAGNAVTNLLNAPNEDQKPTEGTSEANAIESADKVLEDAGLVNARAAAVISH